MNIDIEPIFLDRILDEDSIDGDSASTDTAAISIELLLLGLIMFTW